MAVTSTTMIVSTLALSAMAIVRLERKGAAVVNTRLTARAHARSAVELALHTINNDSAWRGSLANGVETPAQSLGAGSDGSVSWSVQDSDGDLNNSDAVLAVKGFGRIGDTVQVSSVQVRAGEVSAMLRNHELLLDLGHSMDDLDNDEWWGQYFKPSLPSEANGWLITHVEIRARRASGSRQFQARLYRAPEVDFAAWTVFESVSLNSSSVPSSLSWYSIPFPGATWLEVGEGICFALETASGTEPINLSYHPGGVAEGDSALVRGNPVWNSFEPDKALQYRVHGVYTTSNNVGAVAGTWEWDVP